MTSRQVWGLGIPIDHPIWGQIREREAREDRFFGVGFADRTDEELDAEIERLRREVARKRKREEIERLRRELASVD